MVDKPKHSPVYKCPVCGTDLSILLFMGVEPDGYVCPKCKTYFAPKEDGTPEDKPVARVL